MRLKEGRKRDRQGQRKEYRERSPWNCKELEVIRRRSEDRRLIWERVGAQQEVGVEKPGTNFTQVKLELLPRHDNARFSYA